MGWEGDYDTFGPGRGNADYIRAIADAFVEQHIPLQYDSTGRALQPPRTVSLRDLGYFYLNPSSSWDAFNRSAATGDLIPSPTLYPQGIKVVADYVGIRADSNGWALIEVVGRGESAWVACDGFGGLFLFPLWLAFFCWDLPWNGWPMKRVADKLMRGVLSFVVLGIDTSGNSCCAAQPLPTSKIAPASS